MKKIEIIIRPEKLSLLKAIFIENNISGAMFSKVTGYGNQKGKECEYKGIRYFDNMLSKIKAEIVVKDSVVEKIIYQILQEIKTGKNGDGKIFIYDVVDAVRIRTGDRGDVAL